MAEKRKSKQTKNKIFSAKNIVIFVLLLVVCFSVFIRMEFNEMGFEQLIFAITTSEGSNYEIVYKGAFTILLWMGLIYFCWWGLKKLQKFMMIDIAFKFRLKEKTFNFDLFKVTKRRKKICFWLFIIFSLFGSIKLLALDDYYVSQTNYSSIFEERYVAPDDVKIEFPDQKRNLIYIFVESLESSNVSINNGGLVDKSYTPNIERLALDNINFSNTDKIGGAIQVNNTSWTAAALVAHTSGIPLKTPLGPNDYSGDGGYLSGIKNIGDILSDNGYKNYFMLGSDAAISGRGNYFKEHGQYKLLDYKWAKREKKIPKDYYEWWGYEDAKLFEYAKEELLKISKKDEPFNFTILTADTHFTDGYMDKSCKNKFDSAYANSFYCSDSKLNDFVKWAKKQDFYDNTTIVIVGDHLTMQSDFYNTNDNTMRYVFNTFINSSIKTDYSKNREFSILDYFPTTLAALGVDIEGEQLGLGVNLFSGKKTLIEEMGLLEFNNELVIKSFYYEENFFKKNL